jgi:hypothetical protein
MEDPSLTTISACRTTVTSPASTFGLHDDPVIKTPNTILNEGVLLEWTDTGRRLRSKARRAIVPVQLNTAATPWAT